MSARYEKDWDNGHIFPRWRRLAVATAAGGVLLSGCATVPGLQADALVYNDDGTTSQDFYVNEGQTLHHTVDTACVADSDTSEYTVTTSYEPGFTPEGESNPIVETWNSSDLCDGGKIIPNEAGIPKSALND